MRGRPPFGSYIVLRGGQPCALVGVGVVHRDGVLAPVEEGELIADFIVDRKEMFPTIYAKRRVVRAINRTHKACQLAANTLVDEHSILKRICSAKGEWSIKPVLVGQ